MLFIRETCEYVIDHIVNKMIGNFPNKFCAELLHDYRISEINARLSEYAYSVGI